MLDRTKEIITGDGGVVVKIDEWGKKRLAYEIDDSLDGVYYILYFEATPKTLDEVTLGITDVVLRFMPFGTKSLLVPSGRWPHLHRRPKRTD